MNEQDYICKAVELADGFVWSTSGTSKKIDCIRIALTGVYRADELPQPALDALAAQLVRQVDATDDYYVEATWDRTYVMYINMHGMTKVKERYKGEDRTMNTIKAIVDSEVLK